MGESEHLKSHASALNNMRVIKNFMRADDLAIEAQMRFPDLRSVQIYFAILEQLAGACVGPILEDEAQKEVEKAREKYYQFETEVLTDPAKQNKLTVSHMLRCCRKINFLLYAGVNQEYFHRWETVRQKGLMHMNFYEESVFDRGGGGQDDG